MASSSAAQMSEHSPIRGVAVAQAIGERLIVRVSAEVSSALPSRGQVAVRAVIAGEPRTTVLEPDGRKGHWISIDADLQAALAVDDGDEVPVEFEIAPAWPEPQIPADVAEAFEAAADIDALWQDITPMARWEWVRWINATKVATTRARRIEVTVSKLRAGSRRPCCFDLSSCTDPEVSTSGKLIEAER